MELLDQDFLLENDAAKTIFHNYIENLPIIDFHCHLSPQEIYEDQKYENITQAWLGGDHYKWRLMRANGVPEKLITGDGDDFDKFDAFATTLESAFGNPIYEWTHLELKRFFGVDLEITHDNAQQIWDQVNAKLQSDAFSPRALIRNSKVELVATTDDPASDLKYHQLLAEEESEFKVLPALRPDNLTNINAKGFGVYLDKLSRVVGFEIKTFDDIIQALKARYNFFDSIGGRISDHSLSTYHFKMATNEELNKIVLKSINNEEVADEEVDQYLTMLLLELMVMNRDHNWTMQMHVNVNRSINVPMFEKLGPDTGFDSMGTQSDMVQELTKLYHQASKDDRIPKTIFYSLNQNDWMQLATMMGSFQSRGVQQLQLGAGWWFNDTADGMDRQLEVFASQSLLSHFVGMLTDSRSFLSYTRHEYFRRVLANYLGKLSEQGRVPKDMDRLGEMAKKISYKNAQKYFGFYD
ncbi:glucuronate isomerase [Weissella coleopterorum]|uniref:Uronate isomerase n=1 Tax=Weissella coleopterorum TaxID=2714949 RepID=A0A6G8B1U2_9LACO|nr:glucuronate isomerase [Weissella coleopterorum]QIL51179.1 glucuronate isomerase [Weissella coleopterorum]